MTTQDPQPHGTSSAQDYIVQSKSLFNI